MKKIAVLLAMLLVFLVSALMPQGKIVTPVVPGSDKIKIQGYVYFSMGLKALIADIRLTFRDNPVLGAEVNLNETKLAEFGGPGVYSGRVSSYGIRIGNELQISVKLPRSIPGPFVRPPFEGRQKLASYLVDNILEWVFPTPGQVIDLASYPSREIPFRWNFTGPPVASQLSIVDAATETRVLYRMVETEEITIPAAILLPGKSYDFGLTNVFVWCGIMGKFKMSRLAAPGSAINFHYDGRLRFSTAPAK